MARYVKLGDDLDSIIDGYEKIPGLTAHQRGRWHRDGKRKAITHEMLGSDHEKALALPDGTVVGSVKANSARRYWDYGEGHVFPPAEDLVRFACFMHLGGCQSLALVLKNEWEHFFAHEVQGWRVYAGTSLLDVLLDADEKDLRDAQTRFKPDGARLFSLFRAVLPETVPLAQRRSDPADMLSEGLDGPAFQMIVDEIILGRHYFGANNGAELSHFSLQKQKELQLLRDGSREDQQEFTLEKGRWVVLKGDFEDLCTLIENQRLRNTRTMRRWLALFGNEEIELKEAVTRYENLNVRYSLKTVNPLWTAEEVEQAVRAEEGKRREEIRDLKLDAALAPLLLSPGGGGASLSLGEAAQYQEERKKILREITKTLHPDRLVHNPAYRNLTEVQRVRLREMLLDTLKIGRGEAASGSFPRDSMRSLEDLRKIQVRVEAILENPGIDTDEGLIIGGTTLPEKVTWLKRENSSLDELIDSAKAQLQALVEEEDVWKRSSILDHPEQHEMVAKDLRDRIEAYRRLAQDLEEKLAALMSA
ncbi:MAG: hypothetical protein ACYC7J_20390 [Syntrophales bacterium]